MTRNDVIEYMHITKVRKNIGGILIRRAPTVGVPVLQQKTLVPHCNRILFHAGCAVLCSDGEPGQWSLAQPGRYC